jgi:ribA/ribD-fused uncharacterized protein
MSGNIQKIMVSMDIDDDDDDSINDLPDAENPQESLLIGDSMIRDIASTKDNLAVTCIPGAMMCNIRRNLKSIKPRHKKYKDILIVCGTNDAATCKPNDKIAKECESLLQLAKDRATSVHLSSVMPRLDEKVPTNKTDDLNDKLKTLCEKVGVTYINNDLSFKYVGGEVDETLLHPTDKLHLSQQGTRRLLSNLKLLEQAKVVTRKVSENRQEQAPQAANGQMENPLPVPQVPHPPPQPRNCSAGSKKVINFRGAKSPFSNFYMTPIEAWGLQFKSTEHGYAYYKAQEMNEPEKAEEIIRAPNARSAKMIGDTISTNQKWQENKRSVMYYLLLQKAKQCRKFNLELQASRDNILIEDTEHEYWGRGRSGNGQNILGRLLMTIRNNLPAMCEEQTNFQHSTLMNVMPRNRPPNNQRRQLTRFTPAPKATPRETPSLTASTRLCTPG